LSKLIISEQNSIQVCVLVNEKGSAVELTASALDSQSILGNIYVGFVSNIVKNINAAFIDIAGGITCYCSLKETTDYLFGVHASSKGLCIGDTVLVQVERDGLKTKQPAVTGKLQLTGRNLVFLHHDPGIKISNKINDKSFIASVKEVLQPYLKESNGFIVRTNALNATAEELKAEAESLLLQYNEIRTTGIHKSRGTLLYQAQPEYIDFLRDLPQNELEEIVTDQEEVFHNLIDYCEKFQPKDRAKIRFYNDSNLSLGALYSFQKQIREATSKTVLLKSGASLIIEPTETLTVIDVNTAKAISGRKAGDEMFYKINCEAAQECMRQLRLRNLSGMILIDFINMVEEQYNQKLLQYLRDLAIKDRIPVNVIDMTGLGLIELTRKKVKKPLHETPILLYTK